MNRLKLFVHARFVSRDCPHAQGIAYGMDSLDMRPAVNFSVLNPVGGQDGANLSKTLLMVSASAFFSRFVFEPLHSNSMDFTILQGTFLEEVDFMQRRDFTLVEILIVNAIVMILVA